MLEAQGSTRAHTVLEIQSWWFSWGRQRRHLLCREISKAKAPSIPVFFRGSQCSSLPCARKRLNRWWPSPSLKGPSLGDTGTGNKPQHSLQGGRIIHGGTSSTVWGKGGAAWRRTICMFSPIFLHQDDNKGLNFNCNRKRSQFLSFPEFGDCFISLSIRAFQAFSMHDMCLVLDPLLSAWKGWDESCILCSDTQMWAGGYCPQADATSCCRCTWQIICCSK